MNDVTKIVHEQKKKMKADSKIKDKKCPAAVCKSLIKYTIIPEKCTGCLACLKTCPADAISGKKKEVHTIEQDKCTKCGSCYDICKFKAVLVD